MIILKKTGIFRENDYDPDQEGYIYKQVNSVIPYLEENIEMDEDFTLRDFFDVIGEEMEIMEIVFASSLGRHPLAPYVAEAQQDCMPDNREEMEYIECSWVSEQFDYNLFYKNHKDDVDDEESVVGQLGMDLHEPTEDDMNEVSIYVDVHGWGKYDPGKDEVYPKGEKPPTHTSYAIEFTPLHKMAHLPIKLDTDFVMRGRNEIGNEEPILQGKRHFTVFEVFGALLSEISFCGSPKERDEQWESIVDDVDEMKEKHENDEEEDDAE